MCCVTQHAVDSATTLNEIARQSGVGMMLYENKLPIREQVRAACEFLGFDPLYIANEGKLVAICPTSSSRDIITNHASASLGSEAAIIGEVIEDPHHFVQMETKFWRPAGGRLVQWRTVAAYLLRILTL